MAKVDDLDLKLLSELKKRWKYIYSTFSKKIKHQRICFVQSNKETDKKEDDKEIHYRY